MGNGRKVSLPAPSNRVTSSNRGGDKDVVMQTKAKMGAKALGRKALQNNEDYELGGAQSPYKHCFDPENSLLRLKNVLFGQVSLGIPVV